MTQPPTLSRPVIKRTGDVTVAGVPIGTVRRELVRAPRGYMWVARGTDGNRVGTGEVRAEAVDELLAHRERTQR